MFVCVDPVLFDYKLFINPEKILDTKGLLSKSNSENMIILMNFSPVLTFMSNCRGTVLPDTKVPHHRNMTHGSH